MVVDPVRTRIRVRTFAEGLFSRLAHDLELDCADVTGEGDGTKARVEVPIARMTVAGTLKGGRIDADGISGSDKRDVLAKMKKDVFHHDSGNVVVEGELDGGRARLRIVPPKGSAVERTAAVTVADAGDGSKRATGHVELSLDALGSDVVRGPMNAFRIKDTIEVHFDVVFR